MGRVLAGTTFVALLRAVNVSGQNRVPMAELRANMAASGFGDVRTYLQSGNIVFDADADADAGVDAEAGRQAAAAQASFGPALLSLRKQPTHRQK